MTRPSSPRTAVLAVVWVALGCVALGCNNEKLPAPDPTPSAAPQGSSAPSGAQGLPKTIGWDMPSALPTGLSMVPGVQRWTLPDGGRVVAGAIASPQSLAELERSDASARCKEGDRKHLFVLVDWGAALSLPISIAAKSRYGGTRAIGGAETIGISPQKLLELDSQATTFRVWPCKGPLVDMPIADLGKDGNDRYWLRADPSGTLSLLDTEGDKAPPVANNIAAIGLLRPKDKAKQ